MGTSFVFNNRELILSCNQVTSRCSTAAGFPEEPAGGGAESRPPDTKAAGQDLIKT